MIALWLACTASAQESVEAAWERLAAHDTVQASFVQTQHRQVLSRPFQSTGSMAFVRPDKVRWSVDSPTPSVFVLDGARISLSTPALGVEQTFSLEDRPELVGLVGALTVWMRADLDEARERYTVTLEEDRAVLVPRDEVLGRWVSEIALDLAQGGTHVASMTLTEPDGDRVEITFSDVRLGDPVDPATFRLP